MYKDKLDLNLKDEPEDPDYEEDRRIYCLQDEVIRKEHQDAKYRFDDLIRFAKEHKEKGQQTHLRRYERDEEAKDC